MKTHMPHRGFTLIEIMVAVSIFIVVMTVSMGSIYAVFNANKRAEAEKAAMDNLDLALETMSREMRFGSNYHCGSSGDISAPQDCNGSNGSDVVSFRAADGSEIIYLLDGTTIKRASSSENDGRFLAVTAPEVSIENLTFYVFGSGQGDGKQPKALITVKGFAESPGKESTKSEFSLETLVSERLLDS